MSEGNSVTAQGPRDAVTEELVARAWRDPAFKQELLKDPRSVIQRELGIQIPETVTLSVHEETPEALHLVLPLPPAALTQAIVRSSELADADVAGFSIKYSESIHDGSCQVSTDRSVGGVRG